MSLSVIRYRLSVDPTLDTPRPAPIDGTYEPPPFAIYRFKHTRAAHKSKSSISISGHGKSNLTAQINKSSVEAGL